MWVVKLGGSLNDDPVLADWLHLLAHVGGGRVALVCGGGRFADEVRAAQRRWHFDDLNAHNMAVLAMVQSGYMAHGIEPALQTAVTEADIRHVLRQGRTAVWLPLGLCREQVDETTNWQVAADSIALQLAQRLNAERLVVVKSCALDHEATLARQVASGVLDGRFAALADGASFPIELLHKSELPQLRDRLLGLAA